MDVEVVWGSAQGRTELGALDGALADAGIQDYNLVELSSVVPSGASVTEQGTHERTAPRGTVMAVVLADAVVTTDEQAVAGLGWRLAAEGGVFYEATATTVEDCRDTIKAGLQDAEDLRDWDWAPDPRLRIQTERGGEVAASVVAAVVGELSAEWT